jgi:hypothetical protein
MEPNPQRSWVEQVKTIGAVAGAALAVITLAFIFFPGLKPQERIQERTVTLSDLRAQYQPAGDYGFVVFFRAQVNGYQNVPLHVFWNLVDPETGYTHDTWPASPPSLGYAGRHTGPQLLATVQKQAIDADIRIPGRPQPDGRRWKVRIEVFDAQGARVAGPADTEIFSVPRNS